MNIPHEETMNRFNKLLAMTDELDLSQLRIVVSMMDSPLGQALLPRVAAATDTGVTPSQVNKMITAVKLTIFFCEELRKLRIELP